MDIDSDEGYGTLDFPFGANAPAAEDLGDGPEFADVDAAKIDAMNAEMEAAKKPSTISNFTTSKIKGEDGKEKTVTLPATMDEVIAGINERMGGWPRRVDNMLFVDDQKHGLDYFDRRTTAGLFGWLRRHNKVTWAKGGSLVSQSELFAELERTCPFGKRV